MSAVPATPADAGRRQADLEWAEIASAAPLMAETMHRYLRQIATFLAPASVLAADNALRLLARWLVTNTTIVTVGGIGRTEIEQFKIYLVAAAACGADRWQPTRSGSGCACCVCSSSRSSSGTGLTRRSATRS